MATHSQEDKYRVYIDATIPSYLVSNPSRVPQTAEWQKITRDFWRDNRLNSYYQTLLLPKYQLVTETK